MAMDKPNKEEVDSIYKLLGNYNFEVFLKFLGRMYEKELYFALNELGHKEQYWAQGRCQALQHIQDEIDKVARANNAR